MIKFILDNKIYELKDNKVEAICLFGSKARGDQDDLSDIDLFFLIEDCDEDTFVRYKKYISNELGFPAHWISIYRKSTFIQMHSYGAYFLWHLKIEGVVLYSRSGLLQERLHTLPAYNKVEEDLKEYLIICNDIRHSILEDTITLSYELSILASLIRNTCIAFTYLNGLYKFGRIEPVLITKEMIGDKLPIELSDYTTLYNYRIAYTRGTVFELPRPQVEVIQNWVDGVEKFIQFVIQFKKGA